MPHTRSAKKQLRKNIKRRLHNRSVKKDIKLEIKKVEDVAAEGTLEQLKTEYNLAAARLDRAAAKRIIHPNLAARKKSQLARLINKKANPGQAAAGQSK